MKRGATLLWMERALLLAGVVLASWWLGRTWEAARFQADAGRWLAASRGAADAAEASRGSERSPGSAAAARRPARAAEAIGRIAIPRLGISAAIAEGVDARTLSRAVGHVPGTAYPGEPGAVGLAAHRDGYFRPLEHVRPGDRIALEMPGETLRYVVDSTAVVARDRVDVLRSDGDRVLVLVTCYPFRWIGPAPKRFVVWAREEGDLAAVSYRLSR